MKIKVKIANLRNKQPTKPWHVRVDRASPYGNPFRMTKVQTRDAVCDGFQKYFDRLLSAGSKKFDPLLKIAHKYGKITLFCWCVPERCHAKTYKTYIKANVNLDKKA